MIARLRGILGAARDENPTVVCLDRAKSDRNVKIDVEHLLLLPFVVHVVEGHDLLVELKEVNFVCPGSLKHLLLGIGLPLDHSNSSLREIVGHCQLRIPVEADVLLVLAACVA